MHAHTFEKRTTARSFIRSFFLSFFAVLVSLFHPWNINVEKCKCVDSPSIRYNAIFRSQFFALDRFNCISSKKSIESPKLAFTENENRFNAQTLAIFPQKKKNSQTICWFKKLQSLLDTSTHNNNNNNITARNDMQKITLWTLNTLHTNRRGENLPAIWFHWNTISNWNWNKWYDRSDARYSLRFWFWLRLRLRFRFRRPNTIFPINPQTTHRKKSRVWKCLCLCVCVCVYLHANNCWW